MLPLGAKVANLMQELDAARTLCWQVIQNINIMDKAGADQSFAEFRRAMATVNKTTEELNREAKAYDREFKDLQNRSE